MCVDQLRVQHVWRMGKGRTGHGEEKLENEIKHEEQVQDAVASKHCPQPARARPSHSLPTLEVCCAGWGRSHCRSDEVRISFW